MRSIHADKRTDQDLWSRHRRQAETDGCVCKDSTFPDLDEPRYPGAVRLALLLGGSIISWSVILLAVFWLA